MEKVKIKEVKNVLTKRGLKKLRNWYKHQKEIRAQQAGGEHDPK